MKRIIGIMVLVVAMSNTSRSCDLCGCSVSSQYLGLLPQQFNHFVGLQYQYSGYTANQPSPFTTHEIQHAEEYNSTFQLWGRYSLGKRVQLFGFLPYHIIRGKDMATPIKNNGIGDASLLANVIIYNNNDCSRKLKHAFMVGGGIKAPTGLHLSTAQLNSEGLPNVQNGTGAWDFITNVNYTLGLGKSGINTDAGYTLTTANSDNYKYGNRLTANMLYFRQISLKKVIVLPQAGIKYEYALHDYDNYAKKRLNENSGGSLLFGAVGAQAFYKHIGARLLYSLPVHQHYGGGYVIAHPRTETSIYFLF